MAKKKQTKEEKSEEQKREFLENMAKTFLNDASDGGFSADDIIELAVRLSYVMVRFSYIATMPKDMSEDAKKEASENATMLYMAYYGRSNEKELRKKGLSYGAAKKEINKVIAKHKKRVVKDKEKSKS